jgi:hypothetical protein
VGGDTGEGLPLSRPAHLVRPGMPAVWWVWSAVVAGVGNGVLVVWWWVGKHPVGVLREQPARPGEVGVLLSWCQA